MDNDSLRYLIALAQIRGIGPALSKSLIAYVGTPELVFKEKRQALLKIPGIGTVLSDFLFSQREEALRRAEQELEFVDRHKIQTFSYFDDTYPARLKECQDAPLVLFLKGTADLNQGRFLAVVGTRKISEKASAICENFIVDLLREVPQLSIVSGLAFGIDALAHKYALREGADTFAVLGHGLDRIYPSFHRALATKIVHQGGLLTDFLTGTQPDKPNFVRRNRIVAGLCDATVVVESKRTGGALITAGFANDYNRDVFAFPGRIDDECSAGCNLLIKTHKAALIESADDLLCCMNWKTDLLPSSTHAQLSLFPDLSEEARGILSALEQAHDGMQANDLSLLLDRPFSKISSLLLELEFKNLVRCFPGNVYRLLR